MCQWQKALDDCSTIQSGRDDRPPWRRQPCLPFRRLPVGVCAPLLDARLVHGDRFVVSKGLRFGNKSNISSLRCAASSPRSEDTKMDRPNSPNPGRGAGFQPALDQNPASGAGFQPAPISDSWFSDFRELRTDRALFFRNHLGPGSYSIRYLARVRVAGAATAPATKVEEMYHPERFGLSDTIQVTSLPLE